METFCRRVIPLLASALILGATVSADARIGGSGPTGRTVIVQARCPSGRGLGVASHPRPAIVVATRFLTAQRSAEGSGASLSATSDPWLRHRVAPRSPSEFLSVFPMIPPGSDARRFRIRPARWLDARFGPIGPFLNVRLKLLAAGVQAYSCPRRLIHRFVRAIWWIQVILPRCACDPDRVLDLLVARRHGRYRVFSLA
ncbi:MAG: hypothetical protein ACRDH7_09100 [Actinomycetota bacterium]